MYFLITIFIIIVGYYYWDAIKSMFNIFNTTATPSFKIINPWFVALLLINIIALASLLWFYNSRKYKEGIKGNVGPKGFTGYKGENCSLPCS